MSPPSRPHISSIWQEAWTALDEAYGRTAPCAANLRLNGLLTDLVCSDVVTRQDKTPSRTCEVAQELARYHERLRSRNSLSEKITLKGYLKLSEDAQQILGSMIALEMSGIVDNFAQVDFGRPDHHQAVLAAAGRAHRWITEPPGRPKRAHLNDYFEGATELFQKIPSADLTVSNHYDGRPQRPFETILHAGHRMIDRCVTYHATVKAYQRR